MKNVRTVKAPRLSTTTQWLVALTMFYFIGKILSKS